MQSLIPVINKLQDVFGALGGEEPLDLPQIVVVGTQSSGKSSVLENIVGRDFLPRGSGIVTRRPLILQLNNLPPGAAPKKEEDKAFEEWGEFLHKPNQLFYDFNKIREEIEAETARTTGHNKGISPIPINLKIYSPHVLNLTLVDLPGMTRVPVGDQPVDIEMQIRKMVLGFISKRNAIILAVTAANTDMATSDAIQLAREVDPEGLRTLGVITKIDIMDKGTDALDMLLGRVIPLKLGFIGVINRSQQDITQGLEIRTALRNETKYFSTHPLYRTIATRLGTAYLTRTLNKVLMHHIRDCLPELKAKINKMLVDAQTELMSYGDPLYEGKGSQGALLLQVITRFSQDYRDAIDGKSSDLSTHELYGGARINFIFSEIFSECLTQLDPLDDLSIDDIRTVIKNATGPRSALFVPEVSFDLLVKRQIQRLEEPALQCVELVFEELQRIAGQIESKELIRFNALRERVDEVMGALLQQCRSPTRTMIANLISIEMAYINTNHPDFMGGGGAYFQIMERMAAAQRSDQNQLTGSVGGPGGPASAAGPGGQPQQGAQQQPTAQPQQRQITPVTRGGMTSAPAPAARRAAPGAAGQPGQQGSFFNMFFGNRGEGGAPGGPASSSQSSSRMSSSARAPGSSTSRSQPPTRIERLSSMPSTVKPRGGVTDKEMFETELIQSLMVSYFNIVRKNVMDTVPKSIMHFLVNQSKQNVQNELVSKLYKEDLLDELLEESPTVASRRKACQAIVETLRRANKILNDVRDFSI
eukprot:CAMPEP_0177682830 /NCGR_PEP_ID=MMETSP0447-20121125/31460_1 /TAXON_ID=0 /ORGANISM="Stygamoeba regulata, Strain BSH-02190019" /LENGTH=759 /DNA_ID=CAMNT_0019192343 /DNA_START=212 /DNA_END=2491 /DNA_ORIENTATION=-